MEDDQTKDGGRALAAAAGSPSPYYDLYVAETKAHNACALREQALLKDVDYAGREIERLKAEVKRLTEVIDAYADEWVSENV